MDRYAAHVSFLADGNNTCLNMTAKRVPRTPPPEETAIASPHLDGYPVRSAGSFPGKSSETLKSLVSYIVKSFWPHCKSLFMILTIA